MDERHPFARLTAFTASDSLTRQSYFAPLIYIRARVWGSPLWGNIVPTAAGLTTTLHDHHNMRFFPLSFFREFSTRISTLGGAVLAGRSHQESYLQGFCTS